MPFFFQNLYGRSGPIKPSEGSKGKSKRRAANKRARAARKRS